MRQKTGRFKSLGREDPLEEEMATHFSILAWRIPWTEEPGRYQSMRSQRVGHDWNNLAHMQEVRKSVHLLQEILKFFQNIWFLELPRVIFFTKTYVTDVYLFPYHRLGLLSENQIFLGFCFERLNSELLVSWW